MKSRIFQAIGLFVLFLVGVILFRGCESSEQAATDGSAYVPPSP